MDTQAPQIPGHVVDTIAIGGSAGALSSIRDLLSRLPEDFPAAVFLCIHQPNHVPNRSVPILQKQSRLRVRLAEDGVTIRPGTVYVAGPDKHMLIGSDHIHLRRGAHENNFRPAIDPLFRSAAVMRGPRAVAVVCSGLLDDGAAGARAVHRTGGLVLVQDPEEAEYDEMPRAALAARPEAEVLTIAAIAERLATIAGTRCPPPAEVPWEIGLELKITTMEAASMRNEEKLGTLTPFNCPHCNGVLWEIQDGPLVRYRCHTGHAYGSESLAASQEEALDQGLFNALRAFRGRAELVRRLGANESSTRLQQMHARRAEKFEEDADEIERIIRFRTLGAKFDDAREAASD